MLAFLLHLNLVFMQKVVQSSMMFFTLCALKHGIDTNTELLLQN